MPETQRDGDGTKIDSRNQLAFGALICAFHATVMGLLPDTIVPPIFRTSSWMFFSVLTLLCLYLGLPHMWPYSLWLAGVYGSSALGVLLLAGRGDRLLSSRVVAAIIGLLLELAALTLIYNILLRVRTMRSVLGTKSPLGIWMLATILFFVFSNTAAAGWLVWSAEDGSVGFLVYTASEAMLAVLLVYICWAPEELVWSAPRPTDITVAEAAGPALIRKLVGPREVVVRNCPSCGAPLKSMTLRCPSCGVSAGAGWCAAHESFLAPCPSCGSPTLSSELRCIKCGAPFPGLKCPSCGRASSIREWRRATA
ncbi:MAG: hypothetical protein QW379_03140 [Thermoplasmata archaeon]